MKKIYYILAIYHYKMFKFLQKQSTKCSTLADYWYKKYLVKGQNELR